MTVDNEYSARVLERAAKLLSENGLAKGEYWPGDSLPWSAPLELDVTAAIGVALGEKTATGVSRAVVGYAYDVPPVDRGKGHPAFRAVLDELGLDSALELYKWSDSVTVTEAIAVLLDAADTLRKEATQ